MTITRLAQRPACLLVSKRMAATTTIPRRVITTTINNTRYYVQQPLSPFAPRRHYSTNNNNNKSVPANNDSSKTTQQAQSPSTPDHPSDPSIPEDRPVDDASTNGKKGVVKSGGAAASGKIAGDAKGAAADSGVPYKPLNKVGGGAKAGDPIIINPEDHQGRSYAMPILAALLLGLVSLGVYNRESIKSYLFPSNEQVVRESYTAVDSVVESVLEQERQAAEKRVEHGIAQLAKELHTAEVLAEAANANKAKKASKKAKDKEKASTENTVSASSHDVAHETATTTSEHASQDSASKHPVDNQGTSHADNTAAHAPNDQLESLLATIDSIKREENTVLDRINEATAGVQRVNAEFGKADESGERPDTHASENHHNRDHHDAEVPVLDRLRAQLNALVGGHEEHQAHVASHAEEPVVSAAQEEVPIAQPAEHEASLTHPEQTYTDKYAEVAQAHEEQLAWLQATVNTLTQELRSANANAPQKELDRQVQAFKEMLNVQEQAYNSKLASEAEAIQAYFEDQFQRATAALVEDYHKQLSAELAARDGEKDRELAQELVRREEEAQSRLNVQLVEAINFIEKGVLNQLQDLEKRYRDRHINRLREFEQIKANLSTLEGALREVDHQQASNRKFRDAAAVLFNLGNAITANRRVPFEAELSALRSIAAGDELIETTASSLVNIAATGAPTYPQLTKRFHQVYTAGIQAAQVPEQGGLVSNLVAAVASKLVIPGKGTTPTEELFVNAQRYLEQGDLGRAVRLMEQLDGLPSSIARDWIQAARERLLVDQSLTLLQSYITSKTYAETR